MTHILADLRYAFRSLRNAPLFTIVAAASIALAIGANTAVFTLVDQVILRDMPVHEPDRLVQISHRQGFYGGTVGDGAAISYPMYRDLRAENGGLFTGVIGRFPADMHVSFGGRTERVAGELVTGSYFPVLGVRAALGRVMTDDDDRTINGHPVAMLSHAYWSSRFAADPTIIGQKIVVNGQPLTVLGIAARGFHGVDVGSPSSLFVSFSMQPKVTETWLRQDDRRFRWVLTFARLRDGITREQAEAALQGRFRSIVEMEAKEAAFSRASAEAKQRFLAMKVTLADASHGHSNLRRSLTTPLWILMAIAGGVLLIACANVTNLLVARGATRQREIALRLALGASRRRIVQQLLVEGFVLAGLGGLAGLVVATWGAGVLIAFYASPDDPLMIAASPDMRIIAFTFAVVMLATVMCALLPAFQSTRPQLAPTLKAGSGTVLGGGTVGFRKLLVISQVALSLLLLIGAGLFVRSLNGLMAVDPGFRVDRIVTFSLDLERSGYQPARAKQFSKDLLAKLQGTPGVSAASYALFGLLGGGGWGMRISIEGRPGEGVGAAMNAVSPGFFSTLGVPIVAGRDFTPQDERTSVEKVEGWPYRVAIANEKFVTSYLDGRNPIGLHVGLQGDPGSPTPIEIVGVVKDTKYTGIRDDAPAQLFVCYQETSGIGNITAYLRTDRDPAETMAAVRRLVQETDPSLPIYNVRTMGDLVGRSLVNERLIATLSAMFAGLATLLAIVGLYGVMAYTVARRTREIGIRMALGARGRDVAWRVLREASALVVTGLVIGLGAAAWLTRYVESQLFGVRPSDPWTLALCAISLTIVAALAALVPARRAASINPMNALRTE